MIVFWERIKAILRFYKNQSSHRIRAVMWIISDYKRFKVFLEKEYQFSKIKPFRFLHWHHGAYYFIAYNKENNKVFIKTDMLFQLLNNEVNAINILSKDKEIKKHLPNIIGYNLSLPFPFIAVEFIEGISPNKILDGKDKIIKKNEEYIIKEMINIIIHIQRNNIIHRDIRLDNFLFKINDNKINIYLIDFIFCIGVKDSKKYFQELELNNKNLNILKGLGGGLNPKMHYWDDAYSLMQICKLISSDFENIYRSFYEILDGMIGKTVYKL